MALRNIMLFDKDDVLRKKARTVAQISPGIQRLLGDMLETMRHAGGVGLAAPQVGVLRRIITVNMENGPVRLINPEIIASHGQQTGQEGCLSIPNIIGIVTRPETVVVSALNETGVKIELQAEGFTARALCHEIDHLDGMLFIDRAEKGSLRRVVDNGGKIVYEPADDILL